MTLPTSGSLTMSQIATEFRITGPYTLNDVHRGGLSVPSDTATGAGSYQTAPMTPDAGPVAIPTAGALQMSHFYGTAIPASSGVSSGSMDAENTSNVATTYPLTATALIGLAANGQAYTEDALGRVVHGNWYTPTSGSSIIQTFWFRTTVTGGALTASSYSVGTWQQGVSGRDWTVEASAHTTGSHSTSLRSASGYIDISLTNGGAIIGTWSFRAVSEIDANV